MISRIKTKQIKPVSETGFPLHRPFEDKAVIDAEFARWYHQEPSNTQAAPISTMPVPQTTVEDLLVLAREKAREDSVKLLRRGSTRHIAFVALNPYIDVAEIYEPKNDGQYVFDFMIIPPLQAGSLINQKI